MKPHLIVKARAPLQFTNGPIPHWRPFISDKSILIDGFHPEFDRALAQHGIRFWVTTEYAPAGPVWSKEEIAADLNRIYRIILQQNYRIPPGLLDHLRLVPDFEFLREIGVGASPAPVPVRSMSASLPWDNSRELIGLRQARLFSDGHPDVKIAILDTGLNLDHPEIKHRVAAKADFVDLAGLDTADFVGDVLNCDEIPEDEVGHGTHVGGIIAGEGLRIPPGIVPRCRLIAVRVLASMRSGDRLVGAGVLDNINVGIKWAVDNGADVINMSLGIKHSGGGLPHEEVIRYALARGVTVVAASGNDGTEEKYYPGALPGVIAVGAIDERGQVADFSSFGAPVMLVAPGSNVLSSYAAGGYALASGTSQASPFVAGAVALLKSQALSIGIRLPDATIKDILKHTSDKPGQQFRTPRAGYGRLNLVDACRMLRHLLRDEWSSAARPHRSFATGSANHFMRQPAAVSTRLPTGESEQQSPPAGALGVRQSGRTLASTGH